LSYFDILTVITFTWNLRTLESQDKEPRPSGTCQSLLWNSSRVAVTAENLQYNWNCARQDKTCYWSL